MLGATGCVANVATYYALQWKMLGCGFRPLSVVRFGRNPLRCLLVRSVYFGSSSTRSRFSLVCAFPFTGNGEGFFASVSSGRKQREGGKVGAAVERGVKAKETA